MAPSVPQQQTQPKPQHSQIVGTHASQTTRPTPVPNVSAPDQSDTTFSLAQMPSTQPATLATMLAQGPQKLLNAADAARVDVVNTLTNFRDRATLVHVLDAYIPYAIAVGRISAMLRKNGNTDIPKVVWSSGLIKSDHRRTAFHVSLETESAIICTLSGMTAIRAVFETPRQFGTGTDVQIVEQIKSLQKAAGLLKYVHECVAPNALAQHSGMPPPEIVPAVTDMLNMLAIAIAQTLHVRRAIISGMSAATVAKLGMAAQEHVEQLHERLAKCHREQAQLSTDFDHVTVELKNLARAWTYLYSAEGYETPAPKIAAFKEAMKLLKKASQGYILALVAKNSLETLQSKLDDVTNENRVVHRESVPPISELVLPPGRSLVSVTEFGPPRVPEDDEGQQQ